LGILLVLLAPSSDSGSGPGPGSTIPEARIFSAPRVGPALVLGPKTPLPVPEKKNSRAVSMDLVQ